MKIQFHTMFIAFLALCIHGASAQPDKQPVPDVPTPGEKISAMTGITRLVAMIQPLSGSSVSGSVVFEKVPEGIKITAKIGGLAPDSVHAFHIHQYGDLGSKDGSSAGDHFNPDGHPHATPDKAQRHAGDLGNLKADASGNVIHSITVTNIALDHGKTGILGRSVIVHEKPDDGGQPTGNAGTRIGGGVIGLSKDSKPDTVQMPVPGKTGDDATR